MTDLQTILAALNSLGLWAVFLYLYIDERKAHAKTRIEMTLKIDRIYVDHMNDLKEIAGLRAHLNRVVPIVPDHPQE